MTPERAGLFGESSSAAGEAFFSAEQDTDRQLSDELQSGAEKGDGVRRQVTRRSDGSGTTKPEAACVNRWRK